MDFETLLGKSDTPYVIQDQSLRIIFASNGFCELFNMSETSLIGRNLNEFVHPEELDNFRRGQDQYVSGGGNTLALWRMGPDRAHLGYTVLSSLDLIMPEGRVILCMFNPVRNSSHTTARLAMNLAINDQARAFVDHNFVVPVRLMMTLLEQASTEDLQEILPLVLERLANLRTDIAALSRHFVMLTDTTSIHHTTVARQLEEAARAAVAKAGAQAGAYAITASDDWQINPQSLAAFLSGLCDTLPAGRKIEVLDMRFSAQKFIAYAGPADGTANLFDADKFARCLDATATFPIAERYRYALLRGFSTIAQVDVAFPAERP